MPFRPRLAAPAVLKASRQFPVVMLTGARQVGKTTLLRHLDPRRSWVSLDDMDVRSLAREDPRQFLERFPPPVFIDEFQYAPEILPRIKLWVDERRTRLKPAAGAFWLSGSQNFAMMEGVQESLAGRVAVLRLSGFSLPETGAPAGGAPALFNVFLRGDKPELWTRRGLDRETFYSSYVQTYLERDVRGQLGVRQLGLFDKFMRLLAARVGQLLNMASVSSDLGVSIPTVKEWLTVLERSDQVFLLPPYFTSRGKRLVRTPKVYFLDTGLAAHLLRWTEAKTALAGPMAGSLFENWVVSETLKSRRQRGTEPALSFFRTRDGLEVDIVEEEGGKAHLAEVKLSSSPQAAVGELLKRAAAFPGKVGSMRVICTAPRRFETSGVTVAPAGEVGGASFAAR